MPPGYLATQTTTNWLPIPLQTPHRHCESCLFWSGCPFWTGMEIQILSPNWKTSRLKIRHHNELFLRPLPGKPCLHLMALTNKNQERLVGGFANADEKTCVEPLTTGSSRLIRILGKFEVLWKSHSYHSCFTLSTFYNSLFGKNFTRFFLFELSEKHLYFFRRQSRCLKGRWIFQWQYHTRHITPPVDANHLQNDSVCNSVQRRSEQIRSDSVFVCMDSSLFRTLQNYVEQRETHTECGGHMSAAAAAGTCGALILLRLCPKRVSDISAVARVLCLSLCGNLQQYPVGVHRKLYCVLSCEMQTWWS